MSSSRIIYNRKRRSDDESSSSDNSDEDIPPLKKIRDWNTWDTDGNLTFGKIRKVIDWVFQRHSERDGMSRHHCLNQVPIPIEDEEEENIDVVEISSDNDDPIIEEDGDSDEPRRDNLRNPSVYVTTRGITLNSLSRQPVNGCNNIYPMRNKKNSSDHQKMKAVKYVGPITNPSPDVEILFDTREAPEEESDDVEILSEICSTLPSSKSLARPSISSAVSKYALTSSECNGASSGNIANGNTPSYERERSSNKSFTAHEVIRLQEKAHYQLILDKMVGTSVHSYHPIVPKINPKSEGTRIDLIEDKSRLVKKESLVEPVNEFLQKYYKPYHAAYKRCASPKAGLPEFTADDDDVQIIETDSSDSDQYKPKPRVKPADIFSSNWIEEFKKTITLETEQHLQTIALQEEKLERYKKIRGEKFKESNLQFLLGQSIPKEPVKDEFPELTPDMDERIEWALAIGSQTEILSSFKDCTCTSIDLATLTGLNWLNDSIINFYLALIRERCRNHPEYPQVHYFNTYFFAALKNRGPRGVLRWTRRLEDKKNIFEFDIVFVPLHLGMHWALCVVDNRTKKIKYYDSMQGTDDQSVRMVQNYLVAEKKDKLDITMDPNEYSIEMVKDIPQQMNGSDCGMFTLKYAEYLSRDVPITFSQEHMQYFRRRMIFEILDKKLF
ncbi:uncharacterized protein LOC129988238 isoform X2 [Argiope bruennichi]|uniref:uncharacterized protein LOC129988238 isoform X2 n=1 Tax=Argiope bruennichi TaxID=94029 RepID=UPI002494A04B|nr:uncharacterized protein LOC129988238 isoform X2 [Argiope bruennichi]